VAAFIIYCLYQSSASITTPRILAIFPSITVFPLIINKVVLVWSAFFIKCTNIVFSPLNVALLRFS